WRSLNRRPSRSRSSLLRSRKPTRRRGDSEPVRSTARPCCARIRRRCRGSCPVSRADRADSSRLGAGKPMRPTRLPRRRRAGQSRLVGHTRDRRTRWSWQWRSWCSETIGQVSPIRHPPRGGTVSADMHEPASMPLAGKVAFITGAAGGLGQAMTRAFAGQGAAVALADLPERLDELGDSARQLPRAQAVGLDVRDSASIRTAVQTAVDALGSVDIMVCNAGLNVRKSALELTEGDWDTVLDVNLRGVFFSAQAGAAQMVRQSRGGKIVNIASIMGLVGSATSGVAYCASKGGVVNL